MRVCHYVGVNNACAGSFSGFLHAPVQGRIQQRQRNSGTAEKPYTEEMWQMMCQGDLMHPLVFLN